MSKKTKGSSSSSSSSSFDDDFSSSSSSFSSSSSSSSLPTEQLASYFLIGSAVSAFPAYLYSSVFDLSFQEYGLIHLIVLLGTGALLSLAYSTLEKGTLIQLLNMRRVGGGGGESSRKKNKEGGSSSGEVEYGTVVREAQSWSFFVSNLLYTVLFLLFAFYFLKQLDAVWSYAVSSIVAAGITWQVAVATTK